MSSEDGSQNTVTLRRRTWLVGNRYDSDDSFEVKAVTYRDALVTTLEELGWIVLFDSREEAESSIYSATDQPMTCTRCGGRTTFQDAGPDRQDHTCVECGDTFFVEFEDEEEADEDG